MAKNILNNKNCLITGATGGIGKEISIQLAKNGCNLFLTGTNNEKLKSLTGHLTENYPDITISSKSCDLTNISEINDLINQIRNEFKIIDILINSAGNFIIKPLDNCEIEDYEKIFNLNVRAPMLLSKEFSNDMKNHNWGRIINLGSSSSYMGFKNGSFYCSSKFAILGLSRCLTAELKKFGIRTHCISPGSTQTDMAKISTDQNFSTFLNPIEVAKVTIFLLSFNKEMIIDEIRLNRIKIE